MGKLPKLDVSNPDSCSLFYFPGLMEIRSVSVGVVAIKSVSTGLYLAMSKKGTLFGSVRIQPCNIVSGGQDGMSGKGRGGWWRHVCIGVLNGCLPKHVWFVWSGEKSQESTARKSREGSELLSITAVHLGHGWWYLQLELACSTVKIDTREKRNSTNNDKEPAGLF